MNQSNSTNHHEAVIVGAVRTPIGKFYGSLSGYSAVELITETGLLKEILRRSGVDAAAIGEVILGNVLGAGAGQNVARQVAVKGGLPVEVPAFTVNRVCASSLTALDLAVKTIRLGEADFVLCGGTESMSQAPYVLPRATLAQHKMGNLSLIDTMIKDGLWDAFYDIHMGETAENIVEQWKISREDLDRYALLSHQKAIAAQEAGHFTEEIHVIPESQKKSRRHARLEHDEGPRRETSYERLSTLKAVFKQDGSVTAGNAAAINDGAALLMVASLEVAKAQNLPILAHVRGTATVGVDPRIMGHAPYAALTTLRERQNISLDDVDLFEINEAFSAQCLSVLRDTKIPSDRVNVSGGAIALGHPIGASGARIVVTLLHALKQQGKRTGIASLCVGGGQGVAMLFERPM